MIKLNRDSLRLELVAHVEIEAVYIVDLVARCSAVG